jgi:predicted ATPase
VIRSVVLENFRGIRSGRLDALGALAVLVGPAGSGKSAVLEGLFVGASPRPHEAAARVLQRLGLADDLRWLLFRGGEAGTATVQVLTTAGESRSVRLRVPLRRTAEAAGGSARAAAEPAFAPLRDIQDVRLLDAALHARGAAWVPLYEHAVDRGWAAEVDACVAALFPAPVRLRLVDDQTGARRLLLVRGARTLPVQASGDGVRRVLRLALELAACEPGIVLLEEPEAHLHPRAVGQSARMLVAAAGRGVQVVLTTQSLELLDAMLAQCPAELLERVTLHRLELNDGELRSAALPGTDVAVLREALSEDLR